IYSVLATKRGRWARTKEPVHDDLVRREFRAGVPNQLWFADIERHEALLDRVKLGGLHPWAVAAARVKLGAA
ncbi:MAG: hypothetical protein LC808_29580, partial [Actinobacteria bacterium]|nr:hypothetical protein [Actinomycetota bacterium]